MNLTEEIKVLCRKHRADLVGIAPVERFAGAPLRMSPEGLLPGAKSVVVAGIFHGDAPVEESGQPTPYHQVPYAVQGVNMNPGLDDISFLVARFLEAAGFKALPIAASNIWRYKPYKDLNVSFAPDLAHRYAAVAAGLGEIGWSGLALTPEYGPRNRFVSIITDAGLEPTPMYDGPPLCDKCMACVTHCPSDAFRKEVKKINRIEIAGKVFKFPDINKWRCAWVEHFAMDLAHKVPEKVDESTVLDYLEKFGIPAGGVEGCCLRYCLPPQKRCRDGSNGRAPRRRKEILERDPEKLLSAIRKILEDAGADIAAIGQKEDFDGNEQVHPELHLSDVASVICIGTRIPPENADNGPFMASLHRHLNNAAFDVAHYLELVGHSAVSYTHVCGDLTAATLGIHQVGFEYVPVLTGVRLPSFKYERPRLRSSSHPEEIRSFAHELGADLVGFFSLDRFCEFRRTLEQADLRLKETDVIEDRGAMHGPLIPKHRHQAAQIKGPSDWLPEAQSVIVMGLHFPDAALDTAKITPAETVGPFAFVRYEGQRLLGDAAWRLIQRLNDSGHRAVVTYDLAGLASKVKHSRGMLPDLRANRFAALLAGLAHIGMHGCPITAEFGTRQQFVAVVTDRPLPDDRLYDGKIVCRDCDKPCISACPTCAIEDATTRIQFESAAFDIPKIDPFACDWAKRYCLVGEEGPTYCGLDVNEPVPHERNVQAVASALCRVKWGTQKNHVNVVEECIRVCPARGRAGARSDDG